MNCRTCRRVPAKFACKQCKNAFYCSQICAHLDWKHGHFDLCGGIKRGRDELPKMVCGPNILSMYEGFKTNLGEKTIFLFGEVHSQKNEAYDATQLFLDVARSGNKVDIFLELTFTRVVSTDYWYSSDQLTKMERTFQDCLKGGGCNFENVAVHAINYRGGYLPSRESESRGWLPIALIGQIAQLLSDPSITQEETENIREALLIIYPNEIDFDTFRWIALFPTENAYMELCKELFPLQWDPIQVKGSDVSKICLTAQNMMRYHQTSNRIFRTMQHASYKYDMEMSRMAAQILKLKDIWFSPTQNALQRMFAYILHLPPPVMDFNKIITQDIPRTTSILETSWFQEFIQYESIFMDLPAIARMISRDASVVLAYMGSDHVYQWNNFLQSSPYPTDDPFTFPWKSVKTFSAPDSKSCLEIPEEMRRFFGN